MKIFVLNGGAFKGDGGAVFGVVPKVLWQKLIEPDQNNLIPMLSRSLLIEHNGRLILIDAGINDIYGEKYVKINQISFPDGKLSDQIKALGYNPDMVTDIILTHLHHDHCGQLLQSISPKLEPTFPNATIWLTKQQLENAKNPSIREKAGFIPQILEFLTNYNKVKLIENETEILPNIEVKIHQGHTPGLMSIRIKTQNKWLVFASDFIPTSHHVYEPYLMSYDLCAIKTLEEKLQFYQWIKQHEACIIFQHDPQVECGTVKQDEKGHKLKDKLTVKDWI